MYCPGCGVTRLALALLRLDFHTAFHSNAALILLLPIGLSMAVVWAVRSIRTGQKALTRWQNGIVWGMIVMLLLFGVLRNVPAFSCLAPQ